VLINITIVAINFLHNNDEDVHAIAIHNHQKTNQHHCQLDDYFRNVLNQKEYCEHLQHIAKIIAKCFSCEFHFVKNYQNSMFNYSTEITLRINQNKSFSKARLRRANILLAIKVQHNYLSILVKQALLI
jgi:CO dehydrogenase/acetyl-CoA synthase beta subunit